jgi:hypothetical protein
VLVAPLTSPGATFDCRSASRAASCVPQRDSDPANETVSDSLYGSLPLDCRGAIASLAVRHIGTPRQQAIVTCEGATAQLLCAPSTAVDNCTPAPEPIASRGFEPAIPERCDGLVHKIIVSHLHTPWKRSLAVCAPPDNLAGSTP